MRWLKERIINECIKSGESKSKTRERDTQAIEMYNEMWHDATRDFFNVIG